MQYYQTKAGKIPGTDLKEIFKRAKRIYDVICGKSKRRAHVRSRYFKKQKIFLGLFWQHIDDKVNRRDKIRRLKCLPCGIDTIQNSCIPPEIRKDPNKNSVLLYRFRGKAPNGESFVVQIKENIRTGEKFFISVYPE